MNHESYISIVRAGCTSYPGKETYFRPSTKYPEYLFEELSSEKNAVYDAVRESLHLLGLDEEHYGSAEWNPLGEMVHPGMHVLIKPNLVLHYNKNLSGGTECLYTQPSVVAPIIDYVLIALQGSGQVIIGDAPLQECNFEKLIQESGYASLLSYYQEKNITIDLVDFRGLKSRVKNGIIYTEITQNENGTIVDLGPFSEFASEDQAAINRMRVTNYDPRVLSRHHNTEKHEYYISNYVLDADVIINMPKPKTHRKAGVTISLKNFVGANVRKEFLPHHTMGAISEGGDEYEKKSLTQKIRSYLADKENICLANKHVGMARLCLTGIHVCSGILWLKRERYTEGSWHGNHTISRTVVDLNKIIYYADKKGNLQAQKTRNVLIVADMIISGEGEGPIYPSPKPIGFIASGINPICFDEIICTLMGFSAEKIPTIYCAKNICSPFVLEGKGQIPIIRSNDPRFEGKDIYALNPKDLFYFKPTDGWSGHIER